MSYHWLCHLSFSIREVFNTALGKDFQPGSRQGFQRRNKHIPFILAAFLNYSPRTESSLLVNTCLYILK
jgi:hypothetical protein